MGDKNMMSSSYSSSVYNKNTHNLSNNHCHPPSPSDEISQFLRQILVRPSPPSYSPSSYTAVICRDPHSEPRCFASPPSDGVFIKRGISAVQFSIGAGGTNVLSYSVGASGNETDEYECESEEGVEAMVDEPQAKPAPPRSSSKRSRASEVHNLSEKRRRSRINEKMKALQNLIPNSNKMDKASILDEAIEYLKQLQLQVQMLAMRNGLSLRPMCVPGGSLHPTQLPQTSIHPASQEASNQTLPNQTNQFVLVSDMPEIINPRTSLGLESSIRDHFGPFPLLSSLEDISREDILQHHRLDASSHLRTSLSEFEAGAMPAVSAPLNTQQPDFSH